MKIPWRFRVTRGPLEAFGAKNSSQQASCASNMFKQCHFYPGNGKFLGPFSKCWLRVMWWKMASKTTIYFESTRHNGRIFFQHCQTFSGFWDASSGSAMVKNSWYGGFHKWGYPQSSIYRWDFPLQTNHFWIAPWLWKPPNIPSVLKYGDVP